MRPTSAVAGGGGAVLESADVDVPVRLVPLRLVPLRLWPLRLVPWRLVPLRLVPLRLVPVRLLPLSESPFWPTSDRSGSDYRPTQPPRPTNRPESNFPMQYASPLPTPD
mgnify:CR=1 FL=1